MQINMLEAKNQLSQLVRAARDGTEIVIAKRGKPAARLIAIESSSPATVATAAPTGNAAGLIDWLERHPLPAYLHRSHEQIEAGIQCERAAWD